MNKEINIKIAELDGWSQIENTHTIVIGGVWRGYPSVGQIIGQKELIPDYCENLNAICSAVNKFWSDVKFRAKYTEQLHFICNMIPCQAVQATARQRAEALIKVKNL